ncbi:hypothetical protein [Phenylobacterium sp.]|uniref:hypothetical protein n=1 Tax=Phenylobacterium sp. TaxID=1871053 RepID=UPI00121D9129|nr:hypothetical protein [Phenylobacterium sp.]THD57823.1 MAG: hypothetical protein E8A49_21730 [Phenylobacterium sp.]
MRRIWTAASGVLAAGVLLAAGAGQAQVKSGAESGLGLTGADVPPLLQTVEAHPYAPPTAMTCPALTSELVQLDDLLGPDIDNDTEAEPQSRTDKIRSSGADLVRGMVPYGGVVRTLTGASKKDKLLAKAVTAGYARRGFLRGLALTRKCAPPVTAPTAAKPAN